MADFSIKSHDLLPAAKAALTSGLGSPLDLTTATDVKFIMRPTSGGAVKVKATATVEGLPTSGIVRYDWLPGDTDSPGQYQAEWEITWNGGKKQTVPTLTYHSIDVLADLDGA